jgi:hypothetical protein
MSEMSTLHSVQQLYNKQVKDLTTGEKALIVTASDYAWIKTDILNGGDSLLLWKMLNDDVRPAKIDPTSEHDRLFVDTLFIGIMEKTKPNMSVYECIELNVGAEHRTHLFQMLTDHSEKLNSSSDDS